MQWNGNEIHFEVQEVRKANGRRDGGFKSADSLE
jgi:hypothetical protein